MDNITLEATVSCPQVPRGLEVPFASLQEDQDFPSFCPCKLIGVEGRGEHVTPDAFQLRITIFN